MLITLSGARRVIAAAEARAREIGQPMNIAVVDAGGNLVSHVRMDGAWPGLTGIYSSLSPKQTNSRNADHPLAIEFARTVARVQHAVTDTLFHCSVRGYGDPAFGWSAIIAGESSVDAPCSGTQPGCSAVPPGL